MQAAFLHLMYLCTLPPSYQVFITTLNAVPEDQITLDHISDMVLQEDQQRRTTSSSAGTQKSITGAAYVSTAGAAHGTSALVSLNSGHPKQDKPPRTIPKWNYCKKKGHEEQRCFLKFPHLRPESSRAIMPPEPEPKPTAAECWNSFHKCVASTRV